MSMRIESMAQPVLRSACRHRSLAWCLLLSALLWPGLAALAQDAAGGRFRQLGDKAAADGMHALAVRFYRQFKQAAAADRETLLEACLLLASAEIRAGNAGSAAAELAFLEQSFADELAADAGLHGLVAIRRAEVALLAGDADGAVARLEALLRDLPASGDVYLQALSVLGAAHARRQDWDGAEKTYALLEFAARGMPLAGEARGKRVLAVVMSGSLDKARSMLGDDAGTVARERIPDNLLQCIILTREGRHDEARALYRELRPLAGGPSDLWHLAVRGMADAVAANGDTGRAVDLWLDAAHFAVGEGDRQQAFVDAINGRVRLDDRAGAVVLCERFLRDYPGASSAIAVRLQAARLQAELGRVDEALQAFTMVQSAAAAPIGQRLAAARDAGALLVAQRRYEEARPRFEFLAVNAEDEATRGEGLYWLAELLFLQGRVAEAAEAFQAVRTDFPDWRDKALFREIQALIQLKEYPRARADLEEFIRLFRHSPLYPDALFHLARVKQLAGQGGEARAGFAMFAAAFPNHEHAPRAWFEAGELSFGVGDYPGAADAYGALIAAYPQHALVPNALYRRVFARAAAGDDEGARGDADTLIARHADSPYSVHVRYWLADFFRNRRDHAAAEAVLLGIVALPDRPAEAAQALYEAAEVCFAADRADDAIRHLDELNERFPEAPVVSEGQFLRGNIHMSRNEFTKAIPFFRKAAERRPGSPLETAANGRLGDCHYSLAWETPDGTNTQAALALYRKVLAASDLPLDTREQALYKAGRCEEELGDRGSAAATYLEAVYSYETDAEAGYRRDPVWYVKAALAAARIYLAKETPEGAETAISIYRRLIRLGIEPVGDFREKMAAIREQYRLKE
jgi:TolA-binding protein